jgi:hypothetical protein
MDATALDRWTTEPAWPALSADDLRRLRFFAYLRQKGRIRPPAPAGEEAEALCAALLREPPASRAAISGRQHAYHGGLPLLWQAWAEARWARRDAHH